MDEIKYLVIYMDNSCEVHFNNPYDDESSRIILSPCGSEFVHRTYTDNMIKTSFKYRTAYPISIFIDKLKALLKERNKYCNDRPFISPILLESTSTEENILVTTDNLTEAEWELNEYVIKNLDKNPIDIDYHGFYYVWKSKCKKAEFKLHFNKMIVQVKYPVKVPRSTNDEYEMKLDNLMINPRNNFPQSKHFIKYTWNEEEFSVNHLPNRWQELMNKMIELIDLLNNKNKSEAVTNNISDKSIIIKVKFQDAMPLSCTSTHLHKFDDIETSSEPKLIFINQTYYKLFYKDKSIEIKCPSESSGINQIQDFLISDTLAGKYWTLYSLNQRNAEIEEQKLCIDNIPSFKAQIKKSLNYANILLKRLNSIKFLSNFSTCYVNKKLEQIESSTHNESFDDKLLKLNYPSISIENATFKDQRSEFQDNSTASSNETSNTKLSLKNEIKKQYVIQDVGHFKYLINKTIIINFIDKAKLYMDDYSLEMYLSNRLEKSFCLIYLSDNSQHEISLSDKTNLSDYFLNYVNFLEQWIKWLIDTSVIKRIKSDDRKPVLTKTPTKAEFDYGTLQAHINQLKLMNFSISQDLGLVERNESVEDYNHDLRTRYNDRSESIANLNVLSVHNLLKENSKFLESISK